MDVFLVPVGGDAYELYCEHVDEPEAQPLERPSGFWARVDPRYLFARLKHRFHQVLLEAERERRQERAEAAEGNWVRRISRRVMRSVAESIAEQRLLWNLRRHETATLNHPDDMSGEAAMAIMRQQLSRDFDKHRYWLVIDSLLMALSGLLILIPGPNLLGYYFAFRDRGALLLAPRCAKGPRAGALEVFGQRTADRTPTGSHARRTRTAAPSRGGGPAPAARSPGHVFSADGRVVIGPAGPPPWAFGAGSCKIRSS
jgi:hypothetical protein